MPADRTYNVLFLCTGNSARSIMGEALMNHMAEDRFHAYSAGSSPKSGGVNPMTIEVLSEAGISTEGLYSKSWDAFAGADAPKMDFIFTVCDDAAGETCPVWPGQPMTAHWGIEDPAAVDGADFKRKAAFEQAMTYLRNRISVFVNLPLESIDRMALTSKLQGIGEMEGSTRRSAAAN